MFTQRMVRLAEFRAKLSVYLADKMKLVAPNLSALIGETVGARLISHAGSLTNLAKYPASTVQILGAEKALFRALKTKGNTPKYGLIFHSTFIGRAQQKNKGRISRYLANKCSIASRIDCFSDTPTDLFGKKLHEQVEDRLKFYETGEAPMKNADAMQEVLDEFEAVQREERLAEKKKEEAEAESDVTADADTTVEDLNESLKRKADDIEEVEEVEKPKKKKKKKSKSEEVPVNGDSQGEEEVVVAEVTEEIVTEPVKEKKKKKKKSKSEETEDDAGEAPAPVNGDSQGEEEVVVAAEPVEVVEEIVTEPVKEKKKKKSKSAEEEVVKVNGDSQDEEEIEVVEEVAE